MRLLALWLSLAVAVPVLAAPAAVHECQLRNGLRVLVQEDRRAPVAAMELWYKVGASNEYDGITGISHVLEHMMSKGTPHHPKGQFSYILAANGCRKNATTAADFTYYYTEVTPDKIPLVLELEADRMRNLILKPDELARELRVVLEERRMRIDDNPDGLLNERLRAAAFISSPYHHPVAGWPHDIKQLTITDVKQWYRQWYTPNNAILVVVGDINAQQICRLAQKSFGHIPATPLPEPKSAIEMPQLGKKFIEVKFPAKNSRVYLGYPVPSIKTAFQAWEPYALMIIAKLFKDDNGSLQQQLIHRQQLASAITVEYIPYSRLNNLFTIKAIAVSGAHVQTLTQALMAEVNKLQTTLITEQQLQRIKKYLITEQLFAQDNLTSRTYEIGRVAAINVPWQTIREFDKNINAVTAQQIQDVARRYFTENRLNIAVLIAS